MNPIHVAADPYPWPYDGDLRPANTALVIIDMQTDFCGIGGYVDRMGYDLSLTRAPIAPIAAVLGQFVVIGSTSFTPAKDIVPTSPICRRTSAGARAGSAPASATRARAVGSWSAASQAGRSFPSFRLSMANR